MAHASLTKLVVLTNLPGVPHTGATCLLTYSCIAAISLSKSTPSGVFALLKHAIVGVMPWLNAPNVTLLMRPPVLMGILAPRTDPPNPFLKQKRVRKVALCNLYVQSETAIIDKRPGGYRISPRTGM